VEAAAKAELAALIEATKPAVRAGSAGRMN
jgi:hypothetical protein